jgi:alanine racemase
MVRLGIAMYGLLPGPGVADVCAGLIPAMSLKARITAVRWVDEGEAVSYGLRTTLQKSSLIATVPLGYADGVPRTLGTTNIQVLVNGVPRRIAGTITMDQLMIDCEQDSAVTVGDEGDARVTADDWAHALGTIGYEIVCGIGPRVFRRYQ